MASPPPPEPPIFLANGYAGPDAFPAAVLSQCAAEVIAARSDVALQYGPVEGLDELRVLIAHWLRRDGLSQVAADDVHLLPGGKQGLSLVARALAAPGDVVLTSTPTYMTGLEIFRTQGLRPEGVPTDAEGLRTDVLSDVLERHRRTGSMPALLYTMSDFHNPTGAVMSDARRRHLAEVAARYELPVLEDNPYRWMRFEGDSVAPLAAHDEGQQVISVGSFSKILAPGLRVAWMTAPAHLRERLGRFRLELAASPLVQLLIARYFSIVPLEEHLTATRALYAAKRDTMLEALAAQMPEDATWNRPAGGYYVWLDVGGRDSDRICRLAEEQGVVTYPGSAFFPDDSAETRSHLRLNYAYDTPARIAQGIERLAQVVKAA